MRRLGEIVLVATWGVGALGSTGCTRLNASHCGNQSGDATCALRDAATPYCDRCAATNDGCVSQEVIEPECGGMAGSMSSSGGEGPGTTDGSFGSSGSSGSLDSNDTGSSGSVCGDGVLDPGEACDGEALPPGATCEAPGFGDGLPSCEADCSALDYTVCPGYAECGDGVAGPGEMCDGMDLAGQSCDQFEGLNGDGLACTPECTLDSSRCTGCVATGDSCVMDSDCCNEGDLCSGVTFPVNLQTCN